MINRVILLGDVSEDPVLRHTADGTPVCNLEIVTSNGRDRTQRHEVVAWGRLAEFCDEIVRAGDPVCVEGRLDYKAWEHDGRKCWRAQVVAERIERIGLESDRSWRR